MGSVEDTPKTVGKPSEKLPTFRIILIEVRCNADSRCTNGRQHAKREPELMPPISSHTLRHTGCIRLGENNVNPKVMQYVMECWMSGGHPLSTDRSGAKTIQMHRSQ